MKKWTFEINPGNIALILLCTGVNFLGAWLAKRLMMPFWLDSIGTFMAAVLLGPLAGAISGGLLNVIAEFFSPGEIWFALVSIGGGIAVGLFFPRDRKIEPFSVIATALFAGFVMTVISTPLNLYFNNGYVGHPWGDALVDMLSYHINYKTLCCVAGELLVNMPDKAISIFIALSILFFVRKQRDKAGKKKSDGALLLAVAAAISLPALTVCADAARTNYGAEYAAVIYGKDDGLVSAEINTVAQTDDGFIWAGAYSGIYRYNGSEFRQIQLDERISNAMCMYEDSRGGLWIGTNDSGVARYVPETGELTFYSTAEGLSSDSIRAICEDENGCVYVGTTMELCRIDEDGVHAFSGYPQLSGVQSIASLGGERIAGITSRGLLFVLKENKLVFTGESADTDASYSALAFNGDSELLVGSSGSILFRFLVDAEGSLKSEGALHAPEVSDVNCIRYAPEEGGYFVAASVGLAFVGRNMSVESLERDDFGSGVSDIITDYQNNIWFASSNHGIMKLARSPFFNVSHMAGLEETVVNALLSDGNRLYVGTDTGLEILNTSNFGPVNNTATEFLAGERIRHLMKDARGDIWASTYGKHGLVCISPDGSARCIEEEQEDALLGNRFRFTMQMSDGTVLAASTEGLNFLRNGTVAYVIAEDEGLTLPKILCAAECPDGTVLVGSDGDGVYHIRGERVIGHIGVDEGLQSQVVMRIVPCGGGYLYVTSNGLYFQGADTANDAVRRLKAFPYSNNYDVYVADDGKAWVSSSAGLFVVDTGQLIADQNYQYVLLNHVLGFDTTLTSNAWNTVHGDELYLCCTDGVRRVNTKTYDDWNENYRIVMSSLTVEGEPVELVDGVYQIPAGQGRVMIWPAVLNYAISNPLVSIHMEGVDDPGVLIHQNEMNTEYNMTLPYGDYQVHVEVLDELTGETKKEHFFALHKEAELYEYTYYKAYLILVSAMLIAFLAWMIAKMSNMAIIHRQYDQIKEAKEEAEYANHAKSRFLAQMSHEIRTPINAVLGMDEMILRESREEEIRGYAADIYTAGNTLLSLINDILDSSKIESGKMEIVPVEYELATLVRDLRNMIIQRAQAKDLRLELSVDENLPRCLFGDDVRIRQVVTNILTNAVKYTPSGTVWFRVGGTVEGDEATLHVEVEDTGIGIKEEDLPKLFEAYQRIEEGRNRHIEGTGLGMTITIQLLSMMNSKLEVESVYGKGSKFWFDLKQQVVDHTPIGNFTDSINVPNEDYCHEGAFIAPEAHVLVVDDNAMNRKVFRSLLKVTQIQVTEAEGGAEALELAANERFDMVFMDHMMPDMDGVETLGHMRKIEGYDKVPIFVLTANAVTGAKEQYLEAGFDGFISKPVVSERLETALRETLPPELLLPYEGGEGEGALETAPAAPEDLPTVDGLDWSYAWLHLPERELLESTVREFRDVIGIQADKLDRMWQAILGAPEDADAMSAYRIQVHGMKSAAATIGIVPLAGMAKMLEFAARDSDIETMAKLHDVFLAEWRSYREKLGDVFGAEEAEPDEDKKPADADMLRSMMTMLRNALADFDVDAVDGVMERMRSFRYEPAVQELLPALSAAVADLDEDEAERVMKQMEETLT
ncbi:MAG: response regulator [Ruminococcaceae bacterium]|nr:response regulator [Oscillospiraceae bacterium]